MNAITTFSEFPNSPKERAVFVQKCCSEIISGNENPLAFEVMLKNLEETINLIRKDEMVREAILQEANKYAEKSFRYGDYEITKSERGTPDFSNDETWVKLKENIKAREGILKALKPSFSEIADGNTGEMLKPPLMKYSSFLTIKYKG